MTYNSLPVGTVLVPRLDDNSEHHVESVWLLARRLNGSVLWLDLLDGTTHEDDDSDRSVRTHVWDIHFPKENT